ncbi:MAG: hypothetical protein AB8F94_14655 [Saprospiraceae bacterium]
MKKTFHLFLFLSFANVMLGQVGLRVEGTQFAQKSQVDWEKRKELVKVFFTKKDQSQIPQDLKKYFLSDKISANSTNIFTQKSTPNELAFFCRIEEKIELKSKIPLRFRLGEVQAVDQKEGKWKQFQ